MTDRELAGCALVELQALIEWNRSFLVPPITPGHEAGVLQHVRSRAPSRDAERLDYIERTFSGMTNRERYLPVQMIWGTGANGRTLREACDKYMARDAAIAAAEGETK